MEEDAQLRELLRGIRQSTDNHQIAIRALMSMMEDRQRSISGYLQKSCESLAGIERDLSIIKEYLLTRLPGTDYGPDEAAVPTHETLHFAAIRLGLTRAQSEVAAMVSSGMLPPDIALARGCRLSTVNTLLNRANKKLGVARQADMVRKLILSAQGRAVT